MMDATLLSSEILKKIQYIVIHNQKHLPDEACSHFKKLQNYWQDSWQNLYQQLNTSETLNPRDFTMQDKITALIYGDEIIGMHLLKNYKSDDFAKHPYFKPYDQQFFAELEKNNVKRLQSFQYFWVDPNWSRKKTGVHFGAVIASLSLQFQAEESLDASITIARKDIKVHETAEKLGFAEIAKSTIMHNVPVALMACFKPKIFPDVQIAKLANFYWENRTEYKTQTLKVGDAV